MNRTAVIAKLVKCQHNPIQDLKALEAFSDDGLKALEAHCASQSQTFAALQEKLETAEEELKALKGTSETQIKTLQADLTKARKPDTEDEWLAKAPESIKALVESKRKEDEVAKAELVETLKTAQEEFTEDELKAMPLATLQRNVKMLKLDQPAQGDFSAARRAPINRALAEKDVYQNPPDPYAAGIEKLQRHYQIN